ncbi:MAG: hypothetical protein QMD71_08555 [bacterium]|nr:hypothetical protein [bacterium]
METQCDDRGGKIGDEKVKNKKQYKAPEVEDLGTLGDLEEYLLQTPCEDGGVATGDCVAGRTVATF